MLHRALLIAALLCPAVLAADATPAAKPTPQWVYVLKLVPRLHDDAAWTDADKRIVGEHFKQLQRLTAERTVILAGRSTEPGDKTFGLVVFEAPDAVAAQALMESDPAVRGGVMTATLHPYTVALQRTP